MEIKAPEVFKTFDEKQEFQVFHLKIGEGVPAHKHQEYSHDLFIIAGKVKINIGPISKELEAPSTVHFPNGAIHNFEALTDSIVISVHPTWQQ